MQGHQQRRNRHPTQLKGAEKEKKTKKTANKRSDKRKNAKFSQQQQQLRNAAPSGFKWVPVKNKAQAKGANPRDVDATPPSRSQEAQSESKAQERKQKIGTEAWLSLLDVDLEEEWKQACTTIRDVPYFFQSAIREAYSISLEKINAENIDGAEYECAWKLFLLIPRMLLKKTNEKGKKKQRRILQEDS